MTNAQQWLDQTYPIEKRNEIKIIGVDEEKEIKETELNLKVPEDLTGEFINFQGFNNLSELYIFEAEFELSSIYNFPISLEVLQLSTNSFNSNLKPFYHLINLKKLDIGSYVDGSFKRFLFNNFLASSNNWYGSLEPLKNLTKLEWICLATTDVNEGLEYLSNTVKYIGCNSTSPSKKCLELKKILEEFNYNIELYKMTKFEVNIDRVKEIFAEMENDPKLSDKKKKNLLSLKAKMFNFVLSQSSTDINKYSSRIIELSNQIEEYDNANKIALENIKRTRYTITSPTFEDLKKRVLEQDVNFEIILKNFNLKESENKRLTNKIDEFTKFIESEKLEREALIVKFKGDIQAKDAIIKELTADLKSETRKKKVLTASSWIRYASSWVLDEKKQNNFDTFITGATTAYVLKDLDNWSYELTWMGIGLMTWVIIKKFNRWWNKEDKQTTTIINNTTREIVKVEKKIKSPVKKPRKILSLKNK